MNTTYHEFITNILESRERFNIDKNIYTERHHIVPKCIGGNNDDTNLIDLIPKEHFIAHYLLAKENPNEYKLLQALKCMLSIHVDDEILIECSEFYDEIRKLSMKGMSEHNKNIAKNTPPEIKHQRALIGGMARKKMLEDEENLINWKLKCSEVHKNRSEEEKSNMYKKVSESLKNYYATTNKDSEDWQKRQEKNKQSNIDSSKKWRSEFYSLFGATPESYRKYGLTKKAIEIYKQVKNLDKEEQSKIINEFKNSINIEEIV